MSSTNALTTDEGKTVTVYKYDSKVVTVKDIDGNKYQFPRKKVQGMKLISGSTKFKISKKIKPIK